MTTLHIRQEATGKHGIQPAVKRPGVTDIEPEATIMFTYYRKTLLR